MDGESSPPQAGSFYSGLWSRLAGLGSLLSRRLVEETPGGSVVSFSPCLDVADRWGAEAKAKAGVGEEPGSLPRGQAEPQARSNNSSNSSSLLGDVWSKVWLGGGWLSHARRAACYPHPRVAPQHRQTSLWTSDPPASSLHLENANISMWTLSHLSLSTVQRMEKPSELSQFIAVDAYHGYFSLEEEHTCPKQQQQQQQLFNSASDLSPGSTSTMTRSSGPGDLKEKEEEYSSAKSVEAVLLQLLNVDLPTCNRLEIEDKILPFGDEEWTSSDDDTEDDSDEEETSPSISRPQCANKTIAYIMGSQDSDEDDDSEDEESDLDDDGFDSDGSSELSDSDENEILWNSLANFSDPYNLLNFQASIKTRHKLETRIVLESSNPQQPVLCFPNSKDAEERMDSGFSDEPQNQLPLQTKCRKKVAFDEHVTEYYVSSEEVRKGPWEECARDRCRFQKRIKETEKCIGCCFTLEHRRTVLKRMQLVTPEQTGLRKQNSPLLL
ncbi:protein phosphatase 1 regulatory subunit 15B [Amblyraja radiata]|uniref:protein phosphatase 1 regulatory subunit 15B n=1 Tax=Amblyraja radiata TaxID=386614 RepID=UPI001403525B|nr:protein phosphatase 1 regulatory subunit 15B [Amblyraja radiata]